MVERRRVSRLGWSRVSSCEYDSSQDWPCKTAQTGFRSGGKWHPEYVSRSVSSPITLVRDWLVHLIVIYFGIDFKSVQKPQTAVTRVSTKGAEIVM